MALPLEGEGQEIYMRRTVEVGPSSVKSGEPDFLPEAGPFIGHPIAGDFNRSDGIQITPIGELQEADIAKFTHPFTGENFRVVVTSEPGFRYLGDGSPITTARFTIKPAGISETHKVHMPWQQNFVGGYLFNFNFASIDPTDVGVYTLHSRSKISAINLEDGRVLIFCVAANNRVAPNKDHRILASIYDPLTDGVNPRWSALAFSEPISATTSGFSRGTYIDPQCSAVQTSDGDVVIVVSDAGEEKGAKFGILDLWGLPPRYIDNRPPDLTEAKIVLLSHDFLCIKNKEGFVIDGGLTATWGKERLIVAFGALKIIDPSLPEGESPIERSIEMASSSDLRTWCSDSNGRDGFGQIVTQATMINNKNFTSIDYFEYKPLDDTSSDLTPIGYAVTLSGEIFKTGDTSGDEWTEVPNPAKNKIPLTAVKVIQGANGYVVYVGGHKGFLMRSIDNGVTFRIITANSDSGANFKYDNKDTGAYLIQFPDEVTQAQYGWTLDDCELPDPQTLDGKNKGKLVESGMNTDINTILSIPNSDSSTTVFLVLQNMVWVIPDAGNLSTLSTPDRGGAGGPQMVNVYAPYGVVYSADLVSHPMSTPPEPGGEVKWDLLLCGDFPRDRIRNYQVTGRELVPYTVLVKNGWDPVSHFIRIEEPHAPKDSKDYFDPYVHYSTDQAKITAVTDVADGSSDRAYACDNNGNLIELLYNQKISPDDENNTEFDGSGEGILKPWIADATQHAFPTSRDIGRIVKPLDEPIGTTFGGNIRFSDISISKSIGGGEIRSIFLLDNSGIIRRSVPDSLGKFGSIWDSYTVQTSSGAKIQTIVENPGARPYGRQNHPEDRLLLDDPNRGFNVAIGDLLAFSTDSFIVASHGTFDIVTFGLRAYPNLTTLSTGTVLLTVSNIEQQYVELWKLDRVSGETSGIPRFSLIGPQSAFINLDDKQSVAFGDPIRFDRFTGDISIDNDILQLERTIADGVKNVSIGELPEGMLAMITGEESLVSPGLLGTAWQPGKSPELPLPVLYPIDQNGETPTEYNQTFFPLSIRGSRLFGFATIAQGVDHFARSYDSRRWLKSTAHSEGFDKTNLQNSMPILLGEQSIGIANINLLWTGRPKKGDTFDLPVDYQFKTDQMSKESPSFFWRSGDELDEDGAWLEFVWDRQATSITNVMGDGHFFNVNAFAMFGTNFPFATWAISTPDYNIDGGFPANQDNYTEWNLSSVVDEGFFGKGATGNKPFIIDTSKTWRPGQFTQSTHYIMFQKNIQPFRSDTQGVAIRKITYNNADTIFYEGTPIDLTALAIEDLSYIIFNDRFFSDGSGGYREGARGFDPAPRIMGTPYEMGRYLRLRISRIFATHEGYHRIGTPVFGTMTPVRVEMDGKMRESNKFSSGWRWSINPTFVEQRAVSGLSSVKEMGDPEEIFTLAYDQIENWQTEVFYGLLMPRIKQPLVFVPDNLNPKYPYLVRLNDSPQISHNGGIYFSNGVNLKVIK